MQIFINDSAFEVPEKASAEQALVTFGAKPPFALAVNGQFVAQGQYQHLALQDGDRLDILSPIQGG
ncbi:MULTISPECIES: sulfur carrier protein ThiS [unclassified Pseudoalteromonas]|uniref:sulfur carrier protein ThiS n=1 Tax=unclassified Pseudoalteromonas TaxID=194690 RepID=UPI000CF7419B|nr:MULTISPECIES: sulfur carrier protein ThiS [unclassified Pseudoalteromonas]MBS3797411.1 sulfur carrier protein ThiS [Pseudoalteromonas sp. BDTF-M6]